MRARPRRVLSLWVGMLQMPGLGPTRLETWSVPSHLPRDGGLGQGQVGGAQEKARPSSWLEAVMVDAKLTGMSHRPAGGYSAELVSAPGGSGPPWEGLGLARLGTGGWSSSEPPLQAVAFGGAATSCLAHRRSLVLRSPGHARECAQVPDSGLYGPRPREQQPQHAPKVLGLGWACRVPCAAPRGWREVRANRFWGSERHLEV